jgi:hypothetical protein
MKTLKMLVVLGLCAVLLACSGGPPSDVLKAAIGEKANLSFVGMPLTELVDYKITNKYSNDYGSEKHFTFDYEATVEHTQSSLIASKGAKVKVTGSVVLVKRGKAWYSIG